MVYSSVITAQTTRLLDEINLLSIQSQRLVASVDLISQLGGGWDAAQLDQADRGVPIALTACQAASKSLSIKP